MIDPDRDAPATRVSRHVHLRQARRRIAEGQGVAEAVRQEEPFGSGPLYRVDRWKELRARQLGMSAELWDLLNEELVTDVLINGTEVWVDRGHGCERAAWGPADESESRVLAVQMAAAAGKRLDDASPLVDGFLGETIRLHAVIPPLSNGKTTISLRVLRREAFSMDELVQMRTVTEPVAALLETLVRQRVSLLISGATGSGKTTLLAALLGLVPPDERIVCIEEVSELYPNHPHVVHLQERQPNIEGKGAISLTDLVRAALRMRPDRLILGECRGAEVREVLTAMNTGHSGGFATIHANAVRDIPSRLMALGSLAGLSETQVSAHATSAFQVVLQLGRERGGRRRLAEVGVLDNTERLRAVVGLDCRGTQARPGPGLGLLEKVVGHPLSGPDSARRGPALPTGAAALR